MGIVNKLNFFVQIQNLYLVKTCGEQIIDLEFTFVCSCICSKISFCIAKGQLNSEGIYGNIVSPKILTKNYRDFSPGSLLEDRAKIFVIFVGILGEMMNS